MTTWANELHNFSGTERYYRITPDTVITDGAKDPVKNNIPN